MSQFDLTDRAYISASNPSDLPDALAVGVSVQVCSSQPVSEWIVNWGDDKSTTVKSYGFTCNVYHVYDEARTYYPTLKADGSSHSLGDLVVQAPAQTTQGSDEAILDAEADFFADLDLVDELFED